MKQKCKFKQTEKNKERNILEFLEENKGAFTFAGILLAIVVYFSNFSKEFQEGSIMFNNFGWAIIIAYIILLLILAFLFKKANKGNYDWYTAVLCISLFFIILPIYSYIQNKFQIAFGDFKSIAILSAFLFIDILYFIPKIFNYLQKINLNKSFIITSIFSVIFIILELLINYNKRFENFLIHIIFGNILYLSVYYMVRLILVIFLFLFLFKYLPNRIKHILNMIKQKWQERKKQNSNKLK